MIPAIGVGFIGLDVALFMSCIAAAGVNCYYIPSWFKASKGMAVMRIFRVAGWLIFVARYGFVLATTGDILISLPSEIAIFFLAAGEIAAVFNRGKVGKL